MGSSTKKPVKKNHLEKLETATADEIDRQRKVKRKKKQNPPKSSTKAASQSRNKTGGHRGTSGKQRSGGRMPAKVPKNKSSTEIRAMDADDPEFKHPQGRKRKYDYNDPDLDTTKMTLAEVGRYEKQQSANRVRARARKAEAVIEQTAHEEFGDNAQPKAFTDGQMMYAEDVLIAEGKLTLDDWDSEELIRGYRRSRDGRFGPPPKYIPREVAQEAFRRLVRLGERRMRQEYLNVIEELINLAKDPNVSDKVRLEAIKEIQNRTVGKTPDIVVTTEAPWQDMLVDSVIPMDEVVPLTVHGEIKRLPSDAGGDQPSAATATPARAPSASESRSTAGAKTHKQKTNPTPKASDILADWEGDDED
jgi:hypothetical protein